MLAGANGAGAVTVLAAAVVVVAVVAAASAAAAAVAVGGVVAVVAATRACSYVQPTMLQSSVCCGCQSEGLHNFAE